MLNKEGWDGTLVDGHGLGEGIGFAKDGYGIG